MDPDRQRTGFPDVSAFHGLLNRLDWSASPLGDVAGWAPSLRAQCMLVLDAPSLPASRSTSSTATYARTEAWSGWRR